MSHLQPKVPCRVLELRQLELRGPLHSCVPETPPAKLLRAWEVLKAKQTLAQPAYVRQSVRAGGVQACCGFCQGNEALLGCMVEVPAHLLYQQTRSAGRAVEAYLQQHADVHMHAPPRK